MWKSLPLRLQAPAIGETVRAVGYRKSTITITAGPNGNHHTDLKDVGTTSTGTVMDVKEPIRDTVLAPFPCFHVRANFAHGMSGGMVLDLKGQLCGLIGTGYELDPSDPDPISWAATLWPLFKTKISADRGDAYPRGIEYEAIELAIDKIIPVVGLADLDPAQFPNYKLK